MAKYTENTEPSSLKVNGSCLLPMYSHETTGREGVETGREGVETGKREWIRRERGRTLGETGMKTGKVRVETGREGVRTGWKVWSDWGRREL